MKTAAETLHPHLDPVLVAVDFSQASAHAIALAGRLASACHASPLRLLHAETLDAPPYFTHEQMATLERERRIARAEAHRFLEEFGRAHTSYPLTTLIEDGSAGEAILRAADDVQLIVMGTHGRRGLTRWWLGSVAEQVLRNSAKPVLVVRGDGAPPTSEPLAIGVAPAAGDEAGAKRYADHLASCTQGRVVERGNGSPNLVVTLSPWPDNEPNAVKHAQTLLQNGTPPLLFVPRSWDS